MKSRLLVGAAIFVVAVLAIGGPFLVLSRDKSKPEQPTPPLDAASVAASAFLNGYEKADGRVVRSDQGGDTVSEGQAYAMLIAAAVGDRNKFDAAWNWSKANLMQPSGLLAWMWKDGKVEDVQPAADADLDVARALSVASTKFNDPMYATEAKSLAKAIIANEIGYTSDKSPVLLPGPWAKGKTPYVVNPSYASPRTEQELASLTGDGVWAELSSASRVRLTSLIAPGGDTKLPPDWARVSMDDKISAAAGAVDDKKGDPAYGYDAVRSAMRLAESCSADDRALAARIGRILTSSPDRRSAAGMKLDGTIIDKNKSGVAAVATAATLKASGDPNAMFDQLNAAERLNNTHLTYYSSAWVALGRIMLTTPWLGSC